MWALQNNDADRVRVDEATRKKISLGPHDNQRPERLLSRAECDVAIRLADLRNLSAVSAATLVLDAQDVRPAVDSVMLLNSLTFYHEARADLLDALSGLISRRTGRANWVSSSGAPSSHPRGQLEGPPSAATAQRACLPASGRPRFQAAGAFIHTPPLCAA